MKKSTTKQKIILSVLIIWGFCSFIALAAEESPNSHLTIGEFGAFKGIALASFVLCMLAGYWLEKKGMLPETEED